MQKVLLFLFLVLYALALTSGLRKVRSIDLSAAHSLISDTRLPGEIVPNNYTLDIRPIIEESTFTGKVKIVMTFQEPTNKVVLHASHDLEIAENDIKLLMIGIDES
jgi:Peptidase M1 N-terminal domain